MVVGFTTTYAISAYHHWCCEVESRSGRGVQHYVIYNVFQWLAPGRWFSPGPPVSSIYNIDRHDITEILLNVALNTIKQTNKLANMVQSAYYIPGFILNKWNGSLSCNDPMPSRDIRLKNNITKLFK